MRLMPLTENSDRRNVLTVAREERLGRDVDGVFWLASDEGGPTISAQAGFALAAGELISDGDLVQLDDVDDEGRHPVVMTEAGVALWEAWAAA